MAEQDPEESRGALEIYKAQGTQRVGVGPTGLLVSAGRVLAALVLARVAPVAPVVIVCGLLAIALSLVLASLFAPVGRIPAVDPEPAAAILSLDYGIRQSSPGGRPAGLGGVPSSLPRPVS